MIPWLWQELNITSGLSISRIKLALRFAAYKSRRKQVIIDFTTKANEELMEIFK